MVYTWGDVQTRHAPWQMLDVQEGWGAGGTGNEAREPVGQLMVGSPCLRDWPPNKTLNTKSLGEPP